MGLYEFRRPYNMPGERFRLLAICSAGHSKILIASYLFLKQFFESVFHLCLSLIVLRVRVFDAYS